MATDSLLVDVREIRGYPRRKREIIVNEEMCSHFVARSKKKHYYLGEVQKI